MDPWDDPGCAEDVAKAAAALIDQETMDTFNESVGRVTEAWQSWQQAQNSNGGPVEIAERHRLFLLAKVLALRWGLKAMDAADTDDHADIIAALIVDIAKLGEDVPDGV